MSKDSIEIDGLDSILKQLAQVGGKVEDQKRQMMESSAKHLQKEIKQAAQTLDDHKFTKMNKKYGTLEENISIEWDEESGTTMITSGDAFWSIFLEYGVGAYDIQSQPFMEPTFRRNRRKIKKMIEKEIKKVMEL